MELLILRGTPLIQGVFNLIYIRGENMEIYVAIILFLFTAISYSILKHRIDRLIEVTAKMMLVNMNHEKRITSLDKGKFEELDLENVEEEFEKMKKMREQNGVKRD